MKETTYQEILEIIDMKIDLWEKRASACQAAVDYRGQADAKQAVITLLDLQIAVMEYYA